MSIYKLLTSTAFTLSIFMSSALLADGNNSDIEAEMAAFNDRFNQVVADRDVEGFLSLYAEDTIWIAPATPPVVGHGEPRATIQFIIEKEGALTHTVDTLFISDDETQVVMIGTADVLVEQVGMDVDGTYLFVLERHEGNWIIVTDMWHQHTGK